MRASLGEGLQAEWKWGLGRVPAMCFRLHRLEGAWQCLIDLEIKMIKPKSYFHLHPNMIIVYLLHPEKYN